MCWCDSRNGFHISECCWGTVHGQPSAALLCHWSKETYGLVETFNFRPNEFKYMSVIAELEQSGLGAGLKCSQKQNKILGMSGWLTEFSAQLLDSTRACYSPLELWRLSIYNELSLMESPCVLVARSNMEVSPVTWYSGKRYPNILITVFPAFEVSFSSVCDHIQRQSGIHKMFDLIICTVGVYLFSGHFDCTAPNN